MTARLIPNLDIALLAEPPTNPNVMSATDFARLVKNVRQEGFLQPVLARRLEGEEPMYEIVDGVHRTRAAREVGLDHLPVVVLPADYPLEKTRLLQIGMNRLRGQLDLTAVAETFAEMQGLELDLELSGFSDDMIAGLLRTRDTSVEDLLGDGIGDTDLGDADDKPAKAFELTVAFASAQELKDVKKALRKQAGRGRDLGVGLKRALGLE